MISRLKVHNPSSLSLPRASITGSLACFTISERLTAAKQLKHLIIIIVVNVDMVIVSPATHTNMGQIKDGYCVEGNEWNAFGWFGFAADDANEWAP